MFEVRFELDSMSLFCKNSIVDTMIDEIILQIFFNFLRFIIVKYFVFSYYEIKYEFLDICAIILSILNLD